MGRHAQPGQVCLTGDREPREPAVRRTRCPVPFTQHADGQTRPQGPGLCGPARAGGRRGSRSQSAVSRLGHWSHLHRARLGGMNSSFIAPCGKALALGRCQLCNKLLLEGQSPEEGSGCRCARPGRRDRGLSLLTSPSAPKEHAHGFRTCRKKPYVSIQMPAEEGPVARTRDLPAAGLGGARAQGQGAGRAGRGRNRGPGALGRHWPHGPRLSDGG